MPRTLQSMGRHPPYSEEEKVTAGRIYGSGGSIDDVAFALKTSHQRARRIIQAAGLAIRPQGGYRPGTAPAARRAPRNSPKLRKEPTTADWPIFSKPEKRSPEAAIDEMRELDYREHVRRIAQFQIKVAGLLRPPLPPPDPREEWEWLLDEAAALDGLVPGADRLFERALHDAGRVY